MAIRCSWSGGRDLREEDFFDVEWAGPEPARLTVALRQKAEVA